MKVTVVIGTRPEAIKLAPVVLRLNAELGFHCRVCLTGQHREMLDQVMDVFGLHADADLELMRPNQSLAEFSARAIMKLDQELAAQPPDLVIVQGDTTSAFCAGLAAFYRRVPFGHVEAGLRTGNLQAPWPEEANRVLTSRLAELHFAPTESARQNLLREGVPADAITVTGNTVIDALLLTLQRVHQRPPHIPDLPEILQPGSAGHSAAPSVVLITGHRRENFGPSFEEICHGIAELAAQFPQTHFVYPVHLNPNVRQPVLRILGGPRSARGNGPVEGLRRAHLNNIHLIEPLSYLPFVALMDRSTLILTDSGGIQEEAPTLGKPVLVMRETTERPEAVEAGTVRLVGTNRCRIVDEVSRLLNDRHAYERMARAHNPYGDGHAAGRIASCCRAFLRGETAAPLAELVVSPAAVLDQALAPVLP